MIPAHAACPSQACHGQGPRAAMTNGSTVSLILSLSKDDRDKRPDC